MKKLCLIIIFCLTTINLHAVSLLDSGLHSRAAGMGNAFSALADDSSAVYYNPALLYDIDRHYISVGYSHLFLNANNFSFSSVFPKIMLKPDVGVSIAFNSLFDSGLKRTSSIEFSNPGVYTAGSDFEFSEYLFILGGGIKIINVQLMQFSGGLNIKYYQKTIGDFKSRGIGFDIGINTKHRLFNFAVVLKNLIGSLNNENAATGKESEDSVPVIIRTGLLLRFKRILDSILRPKDEMPSYRDSVIREYMQWDINPVIDTEFVLGDEIKINLFTGIEGWLNKVIALRLGYNNFQGLSCGLSAQVEPVRFDYSYSIHSELQGTHRITGTYMF